MVRYADDVATNDTIMGDEHVESGESAIFLACAYMV